MSNSMDPDHVPTFLLVLIWTQTVCKGYQQMTQVGGKELMPVAWWDHRLK